VAVDNFAAYLKRRRLELNLSQYDFPGIDHSTVAAWEKGSRRPSRRNQFRLAHILHESPAEIALRLRGLPPISGHAPSPQSTFARNALIALQAGDHEHAYQLARQYSRNAALSGNLDEQNAATEFLQQVVHALPFDETVTLAFDRLSPEMVRRLFVHAFTEDLSVLTTMTNTYLLTYHAQDPVDRARHLRNAARDDYKNGWLDRACQSFGIAIAASQPYLTDRDIILLELEQAEVEVQLGRPVELQSRWYRSRNLSYWHWAMWYGVRTRLAWREENWRDLRSTLVDAHQTFQHAWHVELTACLAGAEARLALTQGDHRPYQHLGTLLMQPDLNHRAGADVYDDLLRAQVAIARETDQPDASLSWAAAIAQYTWRHRAGWAAHLARTPPKVICWGTIPSTFVAPLVVQGFHPPDLA